MRDTDLSGKRTRIWGYNNSIGHGFVGRHRFEDVCHGFETESYIHIYIFWLILMLPHNKCSFHVYQ